jgi:hypothetical protein
MAIEPFNPFDDLALAGTLPQFNVPSTSTSTSTYLLKPLQQQMEKFLQMN